jgi:hypothetical protein
MSSTWISIAGGFAGEFLIAFFFGSAIFFIAAAVAAELVAAFALADALAISCF